MSTGPQSRQAMAEIFRSVEKGDLLHAESLCRARLTDSPDDVNLLGILGAVLLQKQEYPEAERLLLRTIELESGFARPHEDLGVLYLRTDQPGQAVVFFEKAAVLDERRGSVFRGLAVALHRVGRQEDAQAAQNSYLQLTPSAHNLSEAEKLRKAGDNRGAEQRCEELLKLEPKNTAALRMLAIIASDDERFVVAEGLLRRITELAPDNYDAMRDLGGFLADRSRFSEAIEVIEHAISLDATVAQNQLLLGDMLSIVGQTENALLAYENCLEAAPDDPAALLGRGHMLRIAGRRDEAIASYKHCAVIRPDSGDAWWNLASLHGYCTPDDDVERMRSYVDAGELDPADETGFRFALARAAEQCHEYDIAWNHYEIGNAIKRGLVKYDPVDTEVLHGKLRDVFAVELFQQESIPVPAAKTPIFIVGMPRSGSTLVEQILASHSSVEGTGELPYVIMISTAARGAKADSARYPEIVLDFDASQLTGLGRSYLHHALTHCSTDKLFFTDKMPANYSHVGFIGLILPEAKIIDARRDPLATCVANYRQLFAKGKNQSYDLAELGEYYLQYVALMKHWDEVMPGRVLRVMYEDVVCDLEQQVRRILDFCGLPFEQSCIDYYKSERPVNTASSEQVRQPIYTSGIDYHEHYDAHLDELRKIFAAAL